MRRAGYFNVDGKGNPTPLYKEVAPVNREIARLGAAVARLHPTRVYHMDGADDGDPAGTPVHHWADSDDDLPAWMRRRFMLANVTGASNRNRLLVAFFRDEAGEEYFLIVNKDTGLATGAELTTRVGLNFHPSVKSIQRLRRDTGKVETIAVDEYHAFDLPGSTGDLFRFAGPVTASAAFAGAKPVTRPRLVRANPPDGGTAGRLANNVLQFTFDRDARNVHAEIRQLDEAGATTQADVGNRLSRELSDDGRTVVYRDTGGLLISNATYQVDFHWADAPVSRFKVVRGDVDGDGDIADADAAAVKRAQGNEGPFLREDLDGDGKVGKTDLRFARRTVEPLEFDWQEDFESYGDGNLGGQGPWLAAETIPGSVLSKSWISGDAQDATAMSHVIDGSRSATSTHPGLFIGNEARFLQQGGAGGVGRLIIDVVGRVNAAGFHNHGFHLWNSQDVAGDRGGFSCEIVSRSVVFRGARGIVLGKGTTSAAFKPAGGVADIAVHADIDFGAGALTWSCTDVKRKETKGPSSCRSPARPRTSTPSASCSAASKAPWTPSEFRASRWPHTHRLRPDGSDAVSAVSVRSVCLPARPRYKQVDIQGQPSGVRNEDLARRIRNSQVRSGNRSREGEPGRPVESRHPLRRRQQGPLSRGRIPPPPRRRRLLPYRRPPRPRRILTLRRRVRTRPRIKKTRAPV